MRNKYFIGLIVFVGMFAVTARGEKYTLETGAFEKIKVTTNINVVYRCNPDSTGMAWYDGRPGMDDIFYLDIKKDGTLKIQLTDAYWGKPDLPTLHVYSDYLSSVENSSDLNLTVENLVPGASFSANQIGNGSIIVEGIKFNNVSAAVTTGNGSVTLSGSCVNANFRMVGAGLISADRLQALNVKCTILGTGSIGCWPIDNLTVKGLGSTKIYYKGKPNIKKTGGGKLYELPAEPMDYNLGNSEPVKVGSFFPTAEEEIKTEEDPQESHAEEEIQTVVTEDE